MRGFYAGWGAALVHATTAATPRCAARADDTDLR
jgi:hypothetical protein